MRVHAGRSSFACGVREMDGAIGSLTTYAARERRVPEPAQSVPAVPAETTVRSPTTLDAERSVERDATTGSLVYRLVEVSTGFVAVQTPSEARLRLRAYIDGVMGSKAPEPAVQVTA